MNNPEAALTLTAEQTAAVAARGVSVALAAGAGCGKTTVLSQRFLALLEGETPLPLTRIVALTFTNKAARELRQRILAEARKRTESEENSAHWRGIVRDFDRATITTFHSFCGDLIRRYAIEVGIDPGFEILDEILAPTLHDKTLEACLRRWLASQDPDFALLAVDYGLSAVRDALADVLKSQPAIDLEEWSELGAEEVVRRWEGIRASTLVPVVQAFSDSQVSLVEYLQCHECTGAIMKGRCERLIAEIPVLSKHARPIAALEELREVAKVLGGKKTDWESGEVHEEIKKRFDTFRKQVKDLVDYFKPDEGRSLAAAESGIRFARLAKDAIESFERVKSREGMLDFHDLQVLTGRLLREGPPSVVRELRESIAALLVDEFQDTDALQSEILKTLAGDGVIDGRLFLVGDAKQSIYGFRGAEPTIFHEFRESFPEAGRLNLTENYRSVPGILEFVNALFGSTFTGVENQLRPGGTHDEPDAQSHPCVEFLWTGTASKSLADDRRNSEAEAVAKILADRLKTGWLVRDGRSQSRRPATPGDVAILFRARSDFPIYEKALSAAGLDYHVVGDSTFYAQQEVIDVLNLVAVLEDPLDPLALAGVLRGPCFGLSDEGLFWLATAADGDLNSTFANLDQNLENLAADDRVAAIRARQSLDRWRGRKDHVPIAELLDRALVESGFEAGLMGEFLGARKRANVRKLVDLARKFDERGSLTLADFVGRLRADVESPPREEQAVTTDEAGQAVRLMTIHQAKGLEFPIVVLADLDRKSRVESDLVLCHPRLGFLVRPIEDEEGVEADNLGRVVAKRLQAKADRDEALRVFYVATTRAKDHLILSAGGTAADKPTSPSMELLAERFDRATGECAGCANRDQLVARVGILIPPPVELLKPKKASFQPKLLPTARRILREKVDARLDDAIARPIPPRRFDLDPSIGASPSFRQVDRLWRAVILDPESIGEDAVESVIDRAVERLGELVPARIRELCGEHLVALRSLSIVAAIREASRVRRSLAWAMPWPIEVPNATVFLGRLDLAFQDTDGSWHLVQTVIESSEEILKRERGNLVLGATALKARGIAPVVRAYLTRLDHSPLCDCIERFDPSEVQRAVRDFV